MESKSLTNIKIEVEEDNLSDSNENENSIMDCSQADENSSAEEASTSEQCEVGQKKGSGLKYISPYNKRRVLELLMTKGCSALCYHQTVAHFQVDQTYLREYFNKQIKQAVDHVGEECNSLCFQNITDWLLLLEEVGFDEFCDYEPSLIVKGIASNEKQPSPDSLGGIDLKAIYQFLGNSLMGLPQVELNPESAAFLTNEFESLINDVNEVEAEDETKHIQKILLEEARLENDVTKLRAKLSLDPLGIDPALVNLL